MLCFEMVNISGPVVIGLLLVILALSPGLLHIIGNTILLYQASYSNKSGPETSEYGK
jgi:hypothetical protein